MPKYRRANVAGGAYFFTLVTYRRQRFLCDDDVRLALRDGINKTRQQLPFEIDAWVLLPDHLHCIWQLPEGDADFAKRWAMIKRFVTKRCGPRLQRDDWMNRSKTRRNESTLWQRRYWEHMIRGEDDLKRHRNYIHFNPVKHRCVERVVDWPYSTFHRYLKAGVYKTDWCGGEEVNEHNFLE